MDARVKKGPGSMMTELLALLQAGGTRRVDDLARSLDTSPHLVEAMLEDLTRMGYLRNVSGQCGNHCTTCSLEGTCQAASGGRLWTLTERGSQAKP